MTGGVVVVLKSGGDDPEMAGVIRAGGAYPLFEPILEAEAIDLSYDDLVQPGTVLIFTSANAVQALAHGYKGRDHLVLTVGDSTAQSARHAGFAAVQSAQGTVADLLPLVEKEYLKNNRRLLYVRGEDVAYDLVAALGEKSIPCEEIIAYRAVECAQLSLDLLKALDSGAVQAVLVYSRRGGAAFASLVEQYGRTLRLRSTKALCLSPAVVESVSVLPFAQCCVAETPDRDGMLALAKAFLFKEYP